MTHALTAIIRDKIVADGPISIADYMGLALGHPEHGYYVKQDPFGARGDFVTAPEICQIFGEMIGIWLAHLWTQLGGGPISLAELGPGRGTLMDDILRATKSVPGFHECLTIHLVETSPTLAHTQYLALRDQHPRIEWIDRVEELPPNRLLLVANEFLDALPIKQYIMTDAGMAERRVGWDADAQQLMFTTAPAGLSLAKSGSAIPVGTIMEQCPAARSIMRHLAQHWQTHGGAGLFIDYGYFGDAHQDTLQAVKSHLFHPILSNPGDADLTAHVDFASLMDVARDAGNTVHGLATQGQFLLAMGAQLRLEMLIKNASQPEREALVSGLQRLISPQAMGDLFKVMAVISDPRIQPPGF
jgi:NADH dehydrogenase [ubiquinone] 1 alpha subcomplex assembly factor 7